MHEPAVHKKTPMCRETERLRERTANDRFTIFCENGSQEEEDPLKSRYGIIVLGSIHKIRGTSNEVNFAGYSSNEKKKHLIILCQNLKSLYL